MSIFHHLLVPLDLTDKHRVSLDIAKQIAEQNAAKITLIHSVETIEGMDDEETLAFYDKLKRKSETKIAAVENEFREQGIQVSSQVMIGRPVTDIVRFSIEHDVDLIVMTSHKVTPDYTKSWGTLSYQVSLLCQCPVLLVK